MHASPITWPSLHGGAAISAFTLVRLQPPSNVRSSTKRNLPPSTAPNGDTRSSSMSKTADYGNTSAPKHHISDQFGATRRHTGFRTSTMLQANSAPKSPPVATSTGARVDNTRNSRDTAGHSFTSPTRSSTRRTPKWGTQTAGPTASTNVNIARIAATSRSQSSHRSETTNRTVLPDIAPTAVRHLGNIEN